MHGGQWQITKEDYARAEQFLPHHIRKRVYRTHVEPHWLDGGNQFWYRTQTPEGKRFMWFDCVKQHQVLAFDHARLAAALSRKLDRPIEENELPFDSFDYANDRTHIEFVVDDDKWVCELTDYHCEKVREVREGEAISPDGKWSVFVRDHNLWLRDLASSEAHPLTTDGTLDFGYAALPGAYLHTVTDQLLGKTPEPPVMWSSDSSRLLTHRLDEQKVKELCLLQSVPPDGSCRPIPHFYRYPFAGDDHVAKAHMILVDVQAGKVTRVAADPLDAPATTPTSRETVWFSSDGDRAYMLRTTRGHESVTLEVIDCNTGRVEVLYQETSNTNAAPLFTFAQAPLVAVSETTNEMIWFSKVDGWGHLYLIDLTTGKAKRQVTKGSWSVREISRVDWEDRTLFFTAGGCERGRDPYFRHLYRVGLDGGSPVLLTAEDADHEVEFSPTGEYFVDNYSRVDTAPISVVCDAHGDPVTILEHADLTRLKALNWQPPEPFTVKARDGITDLYGVLYRPTNFDPKRTYPVIDAIYPGPQIIRTPKRFPHDMRSHRNFWEPQALAELGFIVVTLDGLGTPYRSRAFIEKAYGTCFGEAGGLEDHVVAIRQLGERFPYLDMNAVGIFGHSGGGYASTRALLKFPEFFKVGVSSAGNHNQLGYSASWGEFWIGYPADDRYDQQANVDLADQLEGKLLLVTGDLDDNVHPALTLQLVYALIEANKDFDFLILPGRNHSMLDLTQGVEDPEQKGDPYFTRKLWDYFVRHLHGVSPPAYEIGRLAF